jgi:diketogulonate reductase-like aldo/keto reductase
MFEQESMLTSLALCRAMLRLLQVQQLDLVQMHW